ncbi:MAG: hypothetical protein GY849_16200, partial [Deltaproteobacteria bacterium]|nr:hypothetical protein [Deltaproteobacteria bacterium]
KAYAPQARKDFIAAVTFKANSLGISEKEIIQPQVKGDVAIIEGQAFPKATMEPRNRIIQAIQQKGFTQVMEEAAYTWFNCFASDEIGHFPLIG